MKNQVLSIIVLIAPFRRTSCNNW